MRHLLSGDHALESLAPEHLPPVAVSLLVDPLWASPEPLVLPNLVRRLHRRCLLHFLHFFPRVFHLHAPLPLSLPLTPTSADVRDVANSPSDEARTLHRLLVIWIPREQVASTESRSSA
jgi:hypothetical protein